MILQWKRYHKDAAGLTAEYSMNPVDLLNISMHNTTFFPPVIEGTGFAKFRLANGFLYIKPENTNMVSAKIFTVGWDRAFS